MKKLFFILLFCINSFGENRVVTLSPSINEIVFALGVGKDVVANTSYCDYPKESKNIKKIGGYASISLEKLLEAKPTIVLTQDYDQKLLKNLKALQINTKVFKTDTLFSIKNTILTLGLYFKKEKRAKELVLRIDDSLKNLKNIVENKKVLFVISPRKSLSNQIYVTGNNLYFEDIIKASGNKNAYFSKSLNQPIVNTEKVIAMNPDIIVLLAPFFTDKVKEQEDVKKAWLSLPTTASINKDVYVVAKLYAGIPSQRVVNFIDDYKKILNNVKNK